MLRQRCAFSPVDAEVPFHAASDTEAPRHEMGMSPPGLRSSIPWRCRYSRSLRIVMSDVRKRLDRSRTRTRPSLCSNSRTSRRRSSLSIERSPFDKVSFSFRLTLSSFSRKVYKGFLYLGGGPSLLVLPSALRHMARQGSAECGLELTLAEGFEILQGFCANIFGKGNG